MADVPRARRGLFDWLPTIISTITGFIAIGLALWGVASAFLLQRSSEALTVERIAQVGRDLASESGHSHAIDGRLDADERQSYEQANRVTDRLARIESALEAIQRASGASLQGRR
jgi:hypothetical protein